MEGWVGNRKEWGESAGERREESSMVVTYIDRWAAQRWGSGRGSLIGKDPPPSPRTSNSHGKKKGGEGGRVEHRWGMEDIKEQVTGGQSLGKEKTERMAKKKKKRDCDGC
jgi:hypothetical protein